MPPPVSKTSHTLNVVSSHTFGHWQNYEQRQRLKDFKQFSSAALTAVLTNRCKPYNSHSPRVMWDGSTLWGDAAQIVNLSTCARLKAPTKSCFIDKMTKVHFQILSISASLSVKSPFTYAEHRSNAKIGAKSSSSPKQLRTSSRSSVETRPLRSKERMSQMI